MSQIAGPPPYRLIGVDVARALALFGMVVAHLLGSTAAESVPASPWFQLVAGRSAALFAVLAGVSLVMSSAPDGDLRPGARTALARRAVFIAGVGLLLGPFGDVAGIAVILTYYGALFVVALPVLGWSARSLALLAAGWALASPVLSILVRPFLPEPALQIPQPLSLLDPVGLVTELVVTGYYPCLTWATYLFAGMAIGRLNLRRASVSALLAAGGLGLALGSLVVSRVVLGSPQLAEQLLASQSIRGDPSTVDELRAQLTLGFFGTTPTGSWWWLAVWSPHSGSIVDLLHTTGCALALIGGVSLLVRPLDQRSRRLVHITFGAGTMTLTLYCVHVLMVAAPVSLSTAQSIVLHLLVLAGLGALFTATSTRGPLERVAPRLHDAARRDGQEIA